MIDSDAPPELDVSMWALRDVKPDPDNPRNNTGAIEMIAASIRKFGFLVPIVVNGEGTIVAGHARYLAAQLLKLERVPVVTAEHLTPEQARAFSVAENRTSDFSFFDLGKLADFVVDLPDDDIAEFALESLLTEMPEHEPDTPSKLVAPEKREGLDLAPFEKYQYVVVLCRSTYDYENLLERLGLEDIQRRYLGGALQRGSSFGRVMEYPDFIARVGP